MANRTTKQTPAADGEAKPVKAGPVNPIHREQTLVTPDELLVSDTEPQIKEDGKVYVSEAVADRAEEEGYVRDEQPRAHGLEQLPRRTDKEIADDNAKLAASTAALEAIQAPLSVKVQQAVEGDDISDVTAKAVDELEKTPARKKSGEETKVGEAPAVITQ